MCPDKVSTKDEEELVPRESPPIPALIFAFICVHTELFLFLSDFQSFFCSTASDVSNHSGQPKHQSYQLSQLPIMSRQLSIRLQHTLAPSTAAAAASSSSILCSSSFASSPLSASLQQSPQPASVTSRVPSATTPDSTSATQLSAAFHPTIAPTATNPQSVFTRRRFPTASRLSPLPTTSSSLVSSRNNRLFSTTTAAMVARQLDGTAIAKAIRERIGAEIAERQKANPRYQPCLKIIQSMFARLT